MTFTRRTFVVKYTVELPKILLDGAADAGQEANKKHPKNPESFRPKWDNCVNEYRIMKKVKDPSGSPDYFAEIDDNAKWDLLVRAHVCDAGSRFTDKGKLRKAPTYLMGSSMLYDLIDEIKSADAATQPPALQVI